MCSSKHVYFWLEFDLKSRRGLVCNALTYIWHTGDNEDVGPEVDEVGVVTNDTSAGSKAIGIDDELRQGAGLHALTPFTNDSVEANSTGKTSTAIGDPRTKIYFGLSTDSKPTSLSFIWTRPRSMIQDNISMIIQICMIGNTPWLPGGDARFLWNECHIITASDDWIVVTSTVNYIV